MEFRIAAYDPFTNTKIPLPMALQVRAVYNLNNLNSLDVTYPADGAGYSRINTDSTYPAELTLEYYDKSISRWVEPMGSRYIVMKAEGDHVEELPVKKYSAISLKWLYRKAKVWSSGSSGGDRVFKDVTIGKMLRTIFSDAYSRGIKIANPSLMDFTDTTDSSGASWGGTVSMSFPVNMSLEEMLNNLVEQGYIDWDMTGRRTQVWKADSPQGLSRDNTGIRLLNVLGVTAAPEQISYESLMTDARIIGETKTWEFKNAYESPWGRLEEIISQSGVNDPITAEEASQKILTEGEKPSRTHTKEFSGSSIITPLKDIRVGDWVTAQTKDELGRVLSEEEMRIQEISMDISGRDYTWNVSLGDRTTDFLEKLARRQSASSGGSSSGTSRTPSGSSTEIVGDFRIPSVPSSFSVTATSRLDAETGIYKGRLNLSWFDDMMGIDPENGDETPQSRRNYDIQYRILGESEWTTLGWFPPDSQRATYYPVDVINPKTKKPYTYEFKIRTIGPETQSAYSDPVMVQMIADQTPPPQPSKPSASASLGVVFVSWDKMSSAGTEMPLDFDYVLVESRHYADTEVVREVGRIYGDALTVPNLEEGVPFSYRLIAVDTAGNKSAASEWSDPVTIMPLVDVASISDSLEAANSRLDGVAEDAQKQFDELNNHLSQSFIRIDDDINAIRSAANSPDVFAQPEAPEDPSEGQLWIDTDNNNLMSIWTGTEWSPVRDGVLEDLENALSTKSTTYFGETAPSNPNYGDLWFNSSNNNEVTRWDGSEWVSVNDTKIQEALEAANGAQATADGKIQTFLAASAPPSAGLGVGDLWFDTSDGNRMHRWDGSEWIDARDTAISDLAVWQDEVIDNLKNGTYSRVSTFYQSTPPTNPQPGDLWLDTTTGTLKAWNSGSNVWEAVTDPELSDAVKDLGADIEAVKDGVIHTYVQTSQPTGTSSNPLVAGDLWFDSDDNYKLWRYSGTSWVQVYDRNIDALRTAVNTKITTHYTSTAPAAKNVGDLWFNTSAGNEVRRWDGSAWILVTDAKISDALNAANDAQATADGKIQTFFQPEPPTGSDLGVGDLWFDSNDGNKQYWYDGSEWVLAQDKFIADFENWEEAFVDSIKAGEFSRVSTFYQATAPSNPLEGDLWMDTTNGVLKRYNVNTKAWDIVQDSQLKDSINDLGTDLEAVKDGVIHTYIQTSPPSGTSDRPLAVGDLWFDSDDNNKLHRYDGSSWVVVTDKSASELLAKTIPVVVHSTSAASASSTAPNGSTWFQHAPTLNDPVIAQWTKENGQWVPVVVASEVIANLDVGKLTAGSANLSSAVVDKLFANIFSAKKITAAQMTVAPNSLFPDPFFNSLGPGYAWSVVNGGIEKYGTGIQNGNYFNHFDISVTPGESYAVQAVRKTLEGSGGEVAIFFKEYDELGTLVGTKKGLALTSEGESSGIYTAGSNVDKIIVGFFTQNSVSSSTKVRLTNVRITKRSGAVLIEDGAVTATHITASESLTAKVAQFLKINADMIEANAVTAAHLEAGSVKAYHMDFVSEDPASGGSMTLNSSGLSLSRDGSTVFQLTNNSVNTISISDENGTQVAGMSNDGSVVGSEGVFDSISLGGDDLYTMLNSIPKGLIAYAIRSNNPDNTQYSKTNDHWNGVMRLEFDYRAGFTYRVGCYGLMAEVNNPDDTTTRVRFGLGFLDDGNFPQPGRNLKDQTITSTRSPGQSRTDTTSLHYLYTPKSDGTASVLISYRRDGGPAGTHARIYPSGSTAFRLFVEECSMVSSTGKVDYLGAINPPSPTNPEPIDTAPATRRVTQTWTASATQSWRNSSTYTSTTSGYRGQHMWQGRWSGDPNGMKKSHALFRNAGNKGTTIAQARSKMTSLEKLEVYLYNGFFYSYNGGTARLHYHNATVTSSYPALTHIGDYKFKRGEGKWIEIKSQAVKNAFMNGAFTGIALDPRGSTSHEYYGYFRGIDGGSRVPKIRATYLTT